MCTSPFQAPFRRRFGQPCNPLFDVDSGLLDAEELSILLDPCGAGAAEMGVDPPPVEGCGHCGGPIDEWVEEAWEGWVEETPTGGLPPAAGLAEGGGGGEDDVDAQTGAYLRVLEWVARMCVADHRYFCQPPSLLVRSLLRRATR